MTVSQWSTTAALNVLSSGTAGTGGVDIDEGCAPSGVNNAMRDIMAQIATFITSATYTGTSPLTLTSTDAGAAAGPILTLYRNSATPAASDSIGSVLFQGEDSAGNTEDYISIVAQIDDPTSTSEDATLKFAAKVAGSMTTMLALGANALKPNANDGTSLGVSGTAWSDLFLASGAVINYAGGDVTVTHTADTLTVNGGDLALTSNTLILGTGYSGAASAVGATYTVSSGVQNWATQSNHTMNNSTPDNTQQTILAFRRNNTALNGISATNTTTTYGTSSDYRLKFDITDMQGAIDRLKRLRPVRHWWRPNPEAGEVDGFIAHEVQAIVPEAIFGEKDAVDKDGAIKAQSGDWAKLVPLLTAALKETISRIETLEARLAGE